MKCRQVKKLISPYLDDALSRDEKRDFDAHIRNCAGCREELKETRTLHQLFASARRFAAPYGFATRVLANLEQKEKLRLRKFLTIRPFFIRAVQVAFALVVVTIGIVSGTLLLGERPEHTEQSAVQESFSLDLFQATPPGSIGGIYITMMRPDHEK
jgi:anti-sigma factor RsiW